MSAVPPAHHLARIAPPCAAAETYRVLGVDPASVTTLETYLQDYFTAILKKLKEVGASSKQTNFYV